jgi:hypothetical protein
VTAIDNVPLEVPPPPPPQAGRKTTQVRTAKRKHFFTTHLLLRTIAALERRQNLSLFHSSLLFPFTGEKPILKIYSKNEETVNLSLNLFYCIFCRRIAGMHPDSDMQGARKGRNAPPAFSTYST